MRRLVVTTAASLLLALMASGCSGGGATADATLVLPSGTGTVTCQEHQIGPPATDYAGGGDADTAKVLTLLKYWKANGDKPFCDGKGPTDADRAWSDLVDRLLDDEPSAPATSIPAPTTT